MVSDARSPASPAPSRGPSSSSRLAPALPPRPSPRPAPARAAPLPLPRAGGHSRGFIFTAVALLLIAFIMLSVSLATQRQSIDEQRSAERFRLEALRSVMLLVDNASLNRFANASLSHAVNKLAVGVADYPSFEFRGLRHDTKDGRFPLGTGTLNDTIYDLMVFGTSNGDCGRTPAGGCARNGVAGNGYFYSMIDPLPFNAYGALTPDHYNLTYFGDERKYVLSNYFNQTATAARLLGYNLSWGRPEAFVFNQTDRYRVRVSFSIPVNLSDGSGSVRIQKRLDASSTLLIEGMPDPSITRGDVIYRQDRSPGAAGRPAFNPLTYHHRDVYLSPHYNTSADAAASEIRTALAQKDGMGWFFGPVTDRPYSPTNWRLDDPIYNSSRIGNFIYRASGTADARAQSAFFGAILIDGTPGFVDSSWSVSGSCNYTNMTETNCLYCMWKLRGNDTLALCPIAGSGGIIPSTIPINPNITWMSASGFSFNAAHNNVFSGLPEALIDNGVTHLGAFGSHPYPTTFSAASMITHQNARWGASHRLWDLTGPRDMAICGFYVASAHGPAYLQRYLDLNYPHAQPLYSYPWNTPFNYQSNDYPTAFDPSMINFGLESMVTGQCYGGALDPTAQATPINERRSRMDYQFHQGPTATLFPTCQGYNIKGMPGCKSPAACSDPTGPRQDGPGRFALSWDNLAGSGADFPVNRYNLTPLAIAAGGIPSTCH